MPESPGADDGGEADGDAVDESPDDEHLDGRRDSHHQRADEEDDGADEDEPPAPPRSAGAAERRAECRARQRAADSQLLEIGTCLLTRQF